MRLIFVLAFALLIGCSKDDVSERSYEALGEGITVKGTVKEGWEKVSAKEYKAAIQQRIKK